MEEEDGDLLADLLELLGDAGDASPAAGGGADAALLADVALGPPPPPPKRTRAATKPSGPKQAIQALRHEVTRLTDELERVRRRGEHACGHYGEMERALAERRKRQRAEDECQALRDAVYRQKQFVRGLHSFFAVRPRFSLRLNLCRYLHRHVRLPRDRSSRWGEFDPHSHDERLHTAMDVLRRETRSLVDGDCDPDALFSVAKTPHFHCEPVDDIETHSMTSVSVYSVDTRDISAVMRGACVAIRDIVTLCPTGHALSVARDIVDADAAVAARNLLYRVMGVRHRNVALGDDVLLDSHVVTSYKLTDDYAIVLWDYVDEDQLHPRPERTNITRETTGACMIRREMCDDGVERTIVRSLATKRYRFHDRDAPTQRFGCVTHESMRSNEQLFRNIIYAQVAAEKQAAAAANASASTLGAGPHQAGEAGCGCLLG